jgi:hypothetical protein
MLEGVDASGVDFLFHVEDIGEAVIASVVRDKGVDETEAAKSFFSSDVFTRLSDKETGLYLKPWNDIYAMLRDELMN